MKIKFSLIIFLFLLVPIITEARVKIKPYVLFKIKAYNTFIQFEKETNFDKIIAENDKIYFDSYWFKLQGANLTFNKFFENNNLTFSLSGSGLTQVEFYSPLRPFKVKINNIEQEEGTTWIYNFTTKTVKITYTL